MATSRMRPVFVGSLVLISVFLMGIAQSTTAQPFQPTLKIPSVRTEIVTPVQIIPNDSMSQYVVSTEFAYWVPRVYEFADINGDGLKDIVLAPSFAQHGPIIPIEIWLNRGDGTFYNGTSTVIDGAAPLVWNAQQIFFADFNSDGRPDVYFTSTGPELPGVGYHNSLLLSQPNGKYVDATERIPSNGTAFNHMAGVGDANGDGYPDIVQNVQGTKDNIGGPTGVKLFYGNGSGGFTDVTTKLPTEIRFMRGTERPGNLVDPTFDYQMIGCVTIADVDGDGIGEIISGTYNRPDRNDKNGTRTIRFHKLGADGNYVERGRTNIPDIIANIAYGTDVLGNPYSGSVLGCSQLLSGDFNGDGRNDILIQWEGNSAWYVQLLRNDGAFQFTDITLDALGTYQTGFDAGGFATGPAHFRLMDVNGDGTLDIVSQLSAVPVAAMLNRIAYLNDGRGKFTPWVPRGSAGPMAVSDILAGAQCPNCVYTEFLPLVFDTNGSGIASLVLLDAMSSVNTTTPSLANPMQSTKVFLTNFSPTNLSASATQADCLFSWGESTYPAFFSPAPPGSIDLAPFRYRFYSQSKAYLGVSATDNRFYYLGPLTSNQLANLGPVAPWLNTAKCK